MLPLMSPLMAPLIAVSLCLAAPGQDEGGPALRWRFKAGQTRAYRYILQRRVRQSLPQPQDFDSTEGLSWTQSVAAVDSAGIASLKLTLTRYTFAQEAESGPGVAVLDFDSDQADVVHPFFTKVRALIGTELTARVDERGRVLSLSGLDAAVEKALEDWADLKSLAPFCERLRRLFRDELWRQRLNAAFFLGAPRKLAPGARWRSEARVAEPGLATLSGRRRHLIEAIEAVDGRRCARVRIDESLSAEAELGPKGGLEGEVRCQPSRGELVFDLELGALKSALHSRRYRIRLTGAGTARSYSALREVEDSIAVLALPPKPKKK